MLVLRYAAALCLGLYLVRQVKKPDRFAGRFFASLMNGSHAPLTDWAFTHLEIAEGATALDVGCGGGRTINKLAAKAVQVYGIDCAAGSVATSRAQQAADCRRPGACGAGFGVAAAVCGWQVRSGDGN
jgi:2-polyprenyl-3-methyl-5-hydroxy-6-metoxy-1,4-benzoquinol methylase